MRLGFQSPLAWSEACDHVEQSLDLKSKSLSAKLYAGLGPALAELCFGLTRQFPHRKKVYYVQGQGPSFERQMAALAREGMSVTALPLTVFDSPDKFKAQLDSESLFVLYAEDDPLLGLLFELEEFEKALAETKLIRVRVSHSHFAYRSLPETLNRLDVHLYSISPKLGIALHSQRLKWQDPSAEGLVFSGEEIESLEKLKVKGALDTSGIEKFESLPIDGMTAPLRGRQRVWDRAVVSFKDLDGWALISRLSDRLGLSLEAAGFEQRLETTSLRRWGGVHTMDWLSGFGFTPEMIRGTIIIDHKLLTDEFTQHLTSVRGEILKIQNG